jgi:hypothetical protein
LTSPFIFRLQRTIWALPYDSIPASRLPSPHQPRDTDHWLQAHNDTIARSRLESLAQRGQGSCI